MRRLLVLAAAMLAGFFVVSDDGVAQSQAPAMKPSLAEPAPHQKGSTRAAVIRQLTNTKVVVGSGGGASTIAGDYTEVGRATLRCLRSRCRLDALMTVIMRNEMAGNQYAICLKVDGAFDDTGCRYAGELPVLASGYHSTTTTGVKSGLSKGAHQAVVYVLTEQVAFLDFYHLTFYVYDRQ